MVRKTIAGDTLTPGTSCGICRGGVEERYSNWYEAFMFYSPVVQTGLPNTFWLI